MIDSEGQYAAAEAILRECLAIRQLTLGEEDWRVGEAKSLLGQTLERLSRFDEAEPLLTAGFAQLQSAPDTPADQLAKARTRVVTLYETWDAAEPGKGHAEKAAEWRVKLEETPKNPNAETLK